MRDYISPEAFADLSSKHGIHQEYHGDLLRGQVELVVMLCALGISAQFGHEGNVKIMDGGRDKWIAENRSLTREVPSYSRTEYPVPCQALR